MSFFEIDGSQKSGSGTILRYSAALSSILKKNLHLFNIRQKREKKGLRPQHLKAIQACNEITKGSLKNAYVQSDEIYYTPGKNIHGGKYFFDITTAGSTTMLSQTIIPILLFANKPSIVEITGGLFQDFAPAAHHLELIVLPLLKRMKIDVSIKIIKPGYVPQGQGIIQLHIKPIKDYIEPINLEKRGEIKNIKGIALSSNLESQNVSDRMMVSFQNEIDKMKKNIKSDIKLIYDETAHQKGASLTCFIETTQNCLIGMDVAGKIGRSSEKIGQMVAKQLFEDFNAKATLDRYTADQLIIYSALAKGTSTYIIPRMTEHIETNLWLIEKFLNAKYEIINNLLTIHGIGYKKSSN
ncbi:MAG: RNA 3'-terminal phosphate cyclase [Candidatus Anoxychlamydiales bacterium]|nr:RNA 3'-terminal phosphate cyclase [Candidatus Anoxychlamydiales bacterium]NGX35483.1 RNA 3'-terminal phosphate cyclase [Candidatus Anoxychlamydiales bacterium]